MGKHHLKFGGTIRWEKVSDTTLRVTLSDKYITPVTIYLGKDTLRDMLSVFELDAVKLQKLDTMP